MVRFIIMLKISPHVLVIDIYIPIWLDLLYSNCMLKVSPHVYLHSNMVRFIIVVFENYINNLKIFTFQYG